MFNRYSRKKRRVRRFLIMTVLLLGFLGAAYQATFYVNPGSLLRWSTGIIPEEELRIEENASLYYSLLVDGEIWQEGSLNWQPELGINPVGLTKEELQQGLAPFWRVSIFSPEKVTLEAEVGSAWVGEKQRYLGVYGDKLAVFEGLPAEGRLEYTLDYEVKDDVRDELEKGIPFMTKGELMQLLESYTS